MPKFIGPVFEKTSEKSSFSVIENKRGQVLPETESINSGTGLASLEFNLRRWKSVEALLVDIQNLLELRKKMRENFLCENPRVVKLQKICQLDHIHASFTSFCVFCYTVKKVSDIPAENGKIDNLIFTVYV